MRVAIIAAMDRRGLIGDEGRLPWHLPRDLRRFRAYTLGKPVIMGRKTFESIGKPLPERLNIILTQDPNYTAPGCTISISLAEALAMADAFLASVGKDEAMIIGGGKVYAEAIHRWDRMYLTIVEGQFQGTTYFPIRELLRQHWRPLGEPERHPADEKNTYPHSFHILERTSKNDQGSSQNNAAQLGQERLDRKALLDQLDLAAIQSCG